MPARVICPRGMRPQFPKEVVNLEARVAEVIGDPWGRASLLTPTTSLLRPHVAVLVMRCRAVDLGLRFRHPPLALATPYPSAWGHGWRRRGSRLGEKRARIAERGADIERRRKVVHDPCGALVKGATEPI